MNASLAGDALLQSVGADDSVDARKKVHPIYSADQLREVLSNADYEYGRLMQDIDFEGVAAVLDGRSFELDFNGYSITAASGSRKAVGTDNFARTLFNLKNGAELTLVASNMESGNTISGFDSQGAVFLDGSSLVVKSGEEGCQFAFTGCSWDMGIWSNLAYSGAICALKSTINISDALFSKCCCMGTSGGAIAVTASKLTVSKTTFERCSAKSVPVSRYSADGGALWAWRSTLDLTDNVSFVECSADSSGGAFCILSCNATLSPSIKNCSAGLDGGAVYLSGTDCEFLAPGSSISNCSAGRNGGGVYQQGSGHTDIQDLTITGCKAGERGPAYYLDFSNRSDSKVAIVVHQGLKIENCTINDSTYDGIFIDYVVTDIRVIEFEQVSQDSARTLYVDTYRLSKAEPILIAGGTSDSESALDSITIMDVTYPHIKGKDYTRTLTVTKNYNASDKTFTIDADVEDVKSDASTLKPSDTSNTASTSQETVSQTATNASATNTSGSQTVSTTTSTATQATAQTGDSTSVAFAIACLALALAACIALVLVSGPCGKKE